MPEIGKQKVLYDLGPTGIIEGIKRRGQQVPFVKSSDTYVSSVIPKIFIHPDQVFTARIDGNAIDCFTYCHRFEDMPKDYAPESRVEFLENGYIALELGKSSRIFQVRYTALNGEVYVYVGTGFHNLKQKFKLSEEDGGTETCEISDQYKLVVFMAEPGTLMPAIEMVSDVPTMAMPNKAWTSKLKDPAEMFVALEGIVTPANDLAPIQKTLFPNKLFRIESKWIQSKDNPKAVRISPALVNGEPWSFDDNLAFLRRHVKSEIDFAVYGSDFDLTLDVLWYCLARYGNSKRFKFNKSKDRLFTDTDWIFENNMGLKTNNWNRTGIGMIDSVMLWPEVRIDDPDEYAEAQVKVYEVCKKHDVSMPVRSMPMKPDRSHFFFAYRYGLDKVGSPSWDELVLQVCNDDELDQLLEMVSTIHLYLPLQKLTVIIDYPLWAGRWMSVGYYLMLLGVDKMVITNQWALFDKKEQGWETIFEPNTMYEGFVKWMNEIKDKLPTQVQVLGDVTRVTSKEPKSRNWIEHFMNSWNSRLTLSPMINGEPLVMPLGNKFYY